MKRTISTVQEKRYIRLNTRAVERERDSERETEKQSKDMLPNYDREINLNSTIKCDSKFYTKV